MAGITTLDALFEHELKDIYDAESRIVDALKEQAQESNLNAITNAFEEHRQQTEGQLQRVEKVFETIGKQPSRGSGCEGIQGLLEEHKAFTRESPSAEILDVFNLTAAAKVERYEITAYESLVRIGEQLGLGDAVDLLRQNLDEEKQTLQKLEHLQSSQNVLQKVQAQAGNR